MLRVVNRVTGRIVHFGGTAEASRRPASSDWLRPSFALVLLALGACRSLEPVAAPAPLRYVGSSTIGQFIQDAESVYAESQFVLDTEGESSGGEAAILEGRADLAGVARQPSASVLAKGVSATLIGQDAIAVVVQEDNPVKNLSREQLKRIFTGEIRNWRELGGPEEAIRAMIVDSSSATRSVFRSAVLGVDNFHGCQVVRPDAAIVERVAADPGAIGTISLSFLKPGVGVRILSVDNQLPLRTNQNYPITRKLYLLWWRGRARVLRFIEWTASEPARAILLARFSVASEETQ